MKLFITGSSGFIGFHLANYLLSHNWEVIGLDAITDYYDVNLKKARLKLLEKNSNYINYEGFVQDQKLLDKIFLDHNPNIVDIFSAASCTTNAITPILKAVEETFGVDHGHLETIHAYTNDQNLVDNMHSKYRRGRAAALNMVITETGAGKAVSKALPSFEGKLTSNAIRVPVPNGSLAILNLELNKETTKEKLNAIIKKYAMQGDLVEQIQYSINNELVSSDIVGTSAPSIYDSNATIVAENGKSVVLYIWYDNEYGYSHQVIRLAKYIAQVRRFTYY